MFKMLKLKIQGIHKKVYNQFKTRALLGERVPDLTLRTLEGQEIRLRDFLDTKHLVLEFGALT